MGQIDWSDEKSTGLNIEAEGQGWMFGTYWDKFDSERWQLEGNLTGSFDEGRWHIAPSAGFNYFEEKQKPISTTTALVLVSRPPPWVVSALDRP